MIRIAVSNPSISMLAALFGVEATLVSSDTLMIQATLVHFTKLLGRP